MKFNNKYFMLDNEIPNKNVFFYDNNIYIMDFKKLDKATFRSITIGLSYIFYFACIYYFSPTINDLFKNINYNIFMVFIRCISFVAFLIPLFFLKTYKRREIYKTRLHNRAEKIDESYLDYLHIRKIFIGNILLFIFFSVLAIAELLVLFYLNEKDYFLQLYMIALSSILGLAFGCENYCASFVWIYKYLKRHKNDEK